MDFFFFFVNPFSMELIALHLSPPNSVELSCLVVLGDNIILTEKDLAYYLFYWIS